MKVDHQQNHQKYLKSYSQLKLIFSEKLLKDEEVIQDINILEDDTLYVFINSVNNNRLS